MAKRKSTKIQEFTPEQLAMLADYYPTIRSKLTEHREIVSPKLAEISDRQKRIEALRQLEASGDLWIRISFAGNLNVWARDRDDRDSYLSILRRPAEAWCKPSGRYTDEAALRDPDDAGDYEEEDFYTGGPPTEEELERALYRIAKIVAEEIPSADKAVARRIAERVIDGLYDFMSP